MKSILTVLLALTFSSQAEISAQENVFSCSEAGNLTHSFRKTDSGYDLLVNFRMYEIRPDWDSETNQPIGYGAVGIDVPIENDNVRMTGMNWIKEKADFFTELFPPTPLPTEGPIDKGLIVLKFQDDNCFVEEKEGFHFVSCRAQGPLNINGVDIESVDFSMQNQMRRTLLSSPQDPNELEIGEVEAVYANLTFAKRRGNGIYMYRSSTTYYPNGNDVQCYKGAFR